jgi:predicted nucleic acid-binding protein
MGELDYLLRVRLGNPALLRFVEDVLDGAFRLEPVTLGLSDASVAAIAERLGTDRILTVDTRDFSIIRSSKGKPFRILPGIVRGK